MQNCTFGRLKSTHPPKQTYHQETSRRVGVDGEFLAEENCTFSGRHGPPRPGPPGVDPGSTYPLAIGFSPPDFSFLTASARS